MKKNERLYFQWLCDFVHDPQSNIKYTYLLRRLHEIEFRWVLLLDKNRNSDGLGLRQRYTRVTGLDSGLSSEHCSVLEMILALCLRTEESLTADDAYGNRTSYWFWLIMTNLKLGYMDDDNYDEHYVDNVINALLDRRYKPNGEGSIVTLENPKRDLRRVEFWYQLMWYLTEKDF